MNSSRTPVTHASKITVITALALAAAGLTACSPVTPTAAPKAPPTAAPIAAPTAPPIAAPTAVADRPSDNGPATPCPVTADVLRAALLTLEDYRTMDDPARLTMTQASCYLGWASAFSVIEGTQAVLWVFQYDPALGGWRPRNGGSDGTCGGDEVPLDVRQHLYGCFDRG
jgi:hypothetical protein